MGDCAACALLFSAGGCYQEQAGAAEGGGFLCGGGCHRGDGGAVAVRAGYECALGGGGEQDQERVPTPEQPCVVSGEGVAVRGVYGVVFAVGTEEGAVWVGC